MKKSSMPPKYRRMGLQLGIFLLLACACSGDGYNCPYGHKCGFDPAPPGRAPPCAQPGLTYCLHPEPYPEHVIRKLVEAGQYDIRTLLSDESREEFDARKKEYPYGYGPNSIPHVDQISLVDENLYKDYNKFQWFNHGTFSEKTPLQPPAAFDPTQYNIKRFQASNYSKFGFQGQGYQPGYFDSTNPYDYERRLRQSGQVPLFNPNYFNTQVFPNQGDWLPQASTGVTHYSPKEWWKYISPSHSGTDVTIQRSITFPTRTLKRRRRNAELVKESAKRTLTGAEALRIALGLANEDASAERPRRQLADNAEELCRVRTQYITPRAALNNRGSWKFVVNMPDNMTQLVRAEICASTECSGICTVPAGYSSRCEQKYIQKRLVALESSGQNLYTDIFWIPSCCQCTIINNN
ncbi:protein spaetzle 5 isoform X2 [Aricia agestis]|uniref:protein spaetzle 5 isoform X2 n=1 Tax=Aricia agestis TaxID=91739 RepID=UPI001C201A80|nr:protein spaetzle 5 isoform X2 [Aricia agestis]